MKIKHAADYNSLTITAAAEHAPGAEMLTAVSKEIALQSAQRV